MFLKSVLCTTALCATAAIGICGAALPARAETDEIRFAQQYGLGYLPISIVKEQSLIEKHARALGLPNTKVSFTQVGTGSAATDMLLSGNLDMELGGSSILVNLWDKTKGRQGVRGIMSLCDAPFYYITVDPRLKSIRDFTPSDRVAVTTVNISMPALILQIAGDKEMTPEMAKLVPTLEVPMSFPDAYAGMLTGKLEVKTQSTVAPFAPALLRNPNARLLFTSYQVLGGAHTSGVLFTTTRWKDANPKSYQAVFDAFSEAQTFIRDHREEAAAIYAKQEPTSLPADIVHESVMSKDLQCTAAPHKFEPVAEQMKKLGIIKTMPASWKDLFFDNVHGMDGS